MHDARQSPTLVWARPADEYNVIGWIGAYRCSQIAKLGWIVLVYKEYVHERLVLGYETIVN